ncbi:MAG: four helix bundle protein [Planctomycetia bacterium]|nr:four helix bundle protein [Planctomycetia bacterium]
MNNPGSPGNAPDSDFAGFRKLLSWQRSFDLIDLVYEAVAQLPSTERFELSSQMRRAAVSIPSNIAEGYYRSPRANMNHLDIALGSAAELDTQVRICLRRGFLIPSQAQPMLDRLFELRKLLFGLRASIERRTRLSPGA